MNKTLVGQVISIKMKNTAIVEVFSKKPHPLYRKLLTRSKKYKADTQEVPVKLGDSVRIAETRPLSKDKNFKIMKVLASKDHWMEEADLKKEASVQEEKPVAKPTRFRAKKEKKV